MTLPLQSESVAGVEDEPAAAAVRELRSRVHWKARAIAAERERDLAETGARFWWLCTIGLVLAELLTLAALVVAVNT